MADFVQTMKDWRRMCIGANDGPDTTKCDNCPMGESRLCAFEISDIGDYELQEAETFITTWAADHLEPVYPTWEEWLKKMGVMADIHDRLNNYKQVMEVCGLPLYSIPTEKVFHHIPADIAQKLEIEPKEG